MEPDSFHAEILEFPGCFGQGETVDEAYSNLEEAAESWIEACLSQGQEIPEPSSNLTFSGRIVLRLPRSIHRKATQLAERDRSSLNTYLVSAVAAKVGAEDFYSLLYERLERRLAITVSDMARALGFWAKDYIVKQTSARAEIQPGGLQIERTATTSNKQIANNVR